jgi:ABC-type transport system substrate-binding protein
MKNCTDKGNGVYEIEIYDYVHDTAGNPVTAEDVVFSFQKADENGSYATVLETVKEIKATGDYTLELTLENERAGNLIGILSSIKIVTKAAWEASSDGMIHDVVGTSPYKVTDYLEGSYVTMEKVDDYWQTDVSLLSDQQQANVDTIKWVIIADQSQSAAAIESGEIDHAMVINSADYGLFMDDDGNAKDGYVVDVTDNNLTYGLTFNCSPNSLCSDINLRKAIATSIDNAAMAENAFKGFGRAVGNYVNPAYMDYDESLEHPDSYYAYDLAKAKDYLAQSSYKGETVKVLISSNRNAKALMVLLESYLTDLGLNVELSQYEAATFNSYYYGESDTEWDLALIVDQGATGADYLWSVLYAANSNLYDFGNLLHCEDAKLQELYDAMASKETNSTQTVQAFLDYVEENCYMYGLIEGYKVNIGGKRVESLSIDRLTNINCGGCVVAADK